MDGGSNMESEGELWERGGKGEGGWKGERDE